MKTTKRTFTMTALSLLLCFCMVFGLAGCGTSQEEVDTTVTNAIAPVSEQITAINGSIDELKAADTELNGYIGALETAVAKLETDLAATNAKITELEESLDGAEYATVTQLTETKTALEGQIATANTAIDTLKAADTTQNSKISALETAKASLESEITAIENRLTIVENSASTGGSCLCDTSLYATKTQLNEAKTALEGQLATVTTAITALQTANGEIDTAIAALETSVGTLEDELATTTTTIETVKAELEEAIEAVETTVLEQLNTLKTATESDIATLKADVAALKAKDTELANKITALETTVATLASKDWANATFATLEQYASVQTTISGIEQEIDDVNASVTALETKLNSKIATDITAAINALRTELSDDYVAKITAATNSITTAYTEAIETAKKEITNAYTAAISSAIKTSEISMKAWVNTTLADGYYTIAQIDAKIAALNTNGNAYDDTEVKADIAALETALATAKTDLTAAYNSAITTAINDNNGVIDTKIANAIATAKSELNVSINAIELRVATLELKVEQNSDKIAELEAEIEELKKQINCLKGNHVAGTYSKNETTHTYTCIVCGTEVTEEHEYIEGACVCGKSEIAVSVAVDFYIGGVELLSEDTAVSEGVLAYYQNNGTVTTTEPTSWNAKLEYNASNGFTLTLNNLSASSGSGDSTIPTRSGIYVESAEPLTIIVEGTNELNVDVFGDGIHSTSKSLTISGSGSLQISGNPNYGIYVYNSDGSNISITSSEISFSGWGGSCIGGTPISVYDNATVLVGDSAETATTWDGTTHWSNYKFVTVLKAEIEESNVTDMKNTLYNGNTYTLQNDLTLSENASVAATGKTPVLNLNEKTIFTNNYSFKCLSGDFTINGNGSFVGNYAKGGILDVQGTNAALRLVGDVTLTNTAEDGYHITWHSSMLDLSDYTGNALMIKNISSFAQETFTIILPDGWKLYHGDGTAFAEGETIAANEIVTADLDVEAKWGTSVDDLTNGGSLAEALASNAVYIQLRQNVTLTDRIEIAEGKTLTIDLNDCTITVATNKDGFYNNGTLTLLNGKILDNNASYCSVTNRGTLTMTDIVINGGNPLKQTQGTATLTRCALTQTANSFYDSAMYAEGGTISATDSSFSANRYAIWVCKTDLTLKGTISLACGDTAYSNDICIENGDLDLSLVTSSLNDVSVYIEGTTNAPATVTLPAGYEAKDASSGDTVDLSGNITSYKKVEIVSAS